MRPPMTSAKNDGVPPPIRKTQLNQKEVLAENQNQKIRPPYQLNIAKDENSRVRIHQVQADEFIDRRNVSDSPIEVYTDDGIELTRPPSDSFPTYRQTNSKLKRFSSDVSDKFIANSKIPLVSRNISNGNLNNSKTNNKSPSSYNSGEVPKNLIINAFDQCQYNSKISSALVLPLSETEPLLTNIETTVSDQTRSICHNKTSASLIFTKKDISNSNGSIDRNSSSSNYNPTYIVHRRSSGANNQNCTISSNSEFDCKPEAALLQHRRSLQLNYSTIGKDSIGTIRPNTTAANRKQHAYSWYAPVYSALEEESEQDSRNSSPIHNLANIRNNIKSENETVSLIEKNHLNIQPQLHHPRIRRSGVCSLPINGVNGAPLTANQNENDGPQAPSLLGGPLPRRRRFENFLKSLVGRKPSKESIATNTISNPPLLPSPEITISPSPSDHDLLRDSGNLNDRITSSTTSLNTVQHKIWNVVPLLKREGSATSLRPEKSNSIVQYTGLRKCETVLALARQSSMVEQIKPQNRLRNSLSVTNNATCSRCSSLLSLAATGSRYSLNPASSGFMTIKSASNNNLFQRTSSNINVNSTAAIPDNNESITCKLCLADVTGSEITRIGHCGCSFCTECMKAYIEFEITEGAYDISCPDAQCPIQGSMTLLEISVLGSTELMERHHRYRLNREIEMDKTRTWCPRAGCETVCLVGTTPIASSSSNEDKVNSITHVLCAVQCPTCREEFCSGCKKPWHSNLSCEENNRRLIAEGQDDSIAILFDNDLIKCCPMCAVPIEKDEGCAQMMCKRCKHVFCWYCLASLDDDFLLRHYDKGPCKNKLGHSRASVVWHRAQVIGIFAGFGILLLVASPLLLLAAPCIICCKCRICSGSTKLEEADPDFEEAIALQSSSPLNAGNLDIDASKNEEIKFRNVKCDETRQH